MNLDITTFKKPFFLITIDTEGDNLWAKPTVATTENAKYLYRFQELCEEYCLKPTYLTNFEMANCPNFRRFGKEVIRNKKGEIGMHLHAWDTPPRIPLTANDNFFHPYLIEYPESTMYAKVRHMTCLLEDVFGQKMISHRAGRWSFDERYAHMLIEEGYLVDCSVTPLLSWKSKLGDPSQTGGTDYSKFPQHAYFIDPKDISRQGDSPLLEVPVTIISRGNLIADRISTIIDSIPSAASWFQRPAKKILWRISPPFIQLRPNGKNGNQMHKVIKYVLDKRLCYAEFMLHSSEFMPGGSPNFTTETDINNLFTDIRNLFDSLNGNFEGATLSEFYWMLFHGSGEC